MNEELLDELYTMFVLKEWQYKIGGELQTPTREDVERVLVAMAGILKKEPQDGMPQVELGRLIMKKRSGKLDVFVHLGEYNDS